MKPQTFFIIIANALAVGALVLVVALSFDVASTKRDNHALKHRWVQVNSDLSATISCIENTAYTRPMMDQCIEDYYAAGKP